jgi:ketosteroid isomerase-like protein
MDDQDAIRLMNARFYLALESLDLPAMEDVWLHERWVHCVHPGWEAMEGWDAIRKSYEEIFASTSWMRVTPTAVRVLVFGEFGIVFCAENITAQSDGDVGLAVAHATNLFRLTASGWKMIHHHASSAPVRVTQPFSGTIQ